MKQTAIVLLALLQYAIVLNAAPSDPSLKVASHDFMDAFSKRTALIDSLMHKIDSVKALPKNAVNEYQLGRLWQNIQVDSAIAHMRVANDIAMQNHEQSLHIMAGSAICSMLPHINASGEALHHFHELDTMGASHEAMLSYHIAGQSIWFTLANSSVLDTIQHIYKRNGAVHSRAICAMTRTNCKKVG